MEAIGRMTPTWKTEEVIVEQEQKRQKSMQQLWETKTQFSEKNCYIPPSACSHKTVSQSECSQKTDISNLPQL